jgi:serine/threonine-protein kinase
MSARPPRSWSAALPPSAEPVPVVPGFRLDELLGWGASGAVWRAECLADGSEVALKVARSVCSAASLEREEEALATIRHPGVVRVLGRAHTDDGRSVGVLELVEGESLAACLARGALPVGPALRVARGIAEALAAAHGSGVVHGDLKPANVMLRADGSVVLLDFGAAASPVTGVVAGGIAGTPAYLSPEQVDGAAASAASDVFALGVMVHEALCGARPFAGEGVQQLLFQIAYAAPPELAVIAPHVPAAVCAACAACLDKDPAARPSAAQLVGLLVETRP